MEFKQAAEKLQRDGYAIIENFLSNEEVSALKKRMHEIVDEVDPKEHRTVFSTTDQAGLDFRQNRERFKDFSLLSCVDSDDDPRNEYFMNSGDRIAFFFEEEALDKDGNLLVDKQLSVNKIGHALHCLDPVFSKISQSSKVKELIKAVGFADPVICQSMYIFKQPKIGGLVVPHQDSTFLDTSPKKLVGIWIPLEDALKDNGCLWFMPGSHKNGVDNDRYMIRKPSEDSATDGITFTNPPLEYDDSKFVPAEMKAGSLALIHGEVVHKSEANKSARSRHAYTFHVFDNKGVEYSKRNWLQPTPAGTFTHLLAES